MVGEDRVIMSVKELRRVPVPYVEESLRITGLPCRIRQERRWHESQGRQQCTRSSAVR
jgi:hypothetical protein